MAKVKLTTPVTTVAKKDNTRVARTRVNELVGDKPDYRHIYEYDFAKRKDVVRTKSDSLSYDKGFRDQIAKGKRGEKSSRNFFPATHTIYDNSYNRGVDEAEDRQRYQNLSPKALVRDSKIPLAPTQFPE